MSRSHKYGIYLGIGLVIAHTLLFRITETVTAVALPALAACICSVIFTLRSEQSLRILSQKSTRPFRGFILFALLVFVLFYFGGTDASMKLQIARALLVDCAAVVLGGQIALGLHRRRLSAS